MRQGLADVMAETAPRADTERVAGFVRGLYEAAIKEEREEREKLLAEAKLLPPAPTTPPPVVPPPPPPTTTPPPVATPPPEPARATPTISLEALDRSAVSTAPRPAAPPAP